MLQENIDTIEKLSYKELKQYAINLAALLTKLGIQKGDVIALGTEKRKEFIPIFLAIVFAGATYTSHDLSSGRGETKCLIFHPPTFDFYFTPHCSYTLQFLFDYSRFQA